MRDMIDSMSLINNKYDPVMNMSDHRSTAVPLHLPHRCSDSNMTNTSLANTTIHNWTAGCNSSSQAGFPSSGPLGGDFATMFMVFFIIGVYCLFAGYACFQQNQSSSGPRNVHDGTGGHRNLSDRERKRFEAERAKRTARIRKLMVTRAWIDNDVDEGNETMKEQSLEETKDEDEDSIAAKRYSRTVEQYTEDCQEDEKVTILSETSRNVSMVGNKEEEPSDSLVYTLRSIRSDCSHTMMETQSECGTDDANIMVTKLQEAAHTAAPEKDANIVTIPLGDCELEALDSASTMDDSTMDDSTFSAAAMNEECLICLARFIGGDTVCESNNVACVHVFHSVCMEEWLMDHDACPVCREMYLVETV